MQLVSYKMDTPDFRHLVPTTLGGLILAALKNTEVY